MSEARWWPKGKVPTEPGNYLQRVGKAMYGTQIPTDHSFNRESEFYGPIPEPPREPPRLRRFTATHIARGRVSGVFCCDECSGRKNYCYYFFEKDLAACAYFCDAPQLSDIQWLDPVN